MAAPSRLAIASQIAAGLLSTANEDGPFWTGHDDESRHQLAQRAFLIADALIDYEDELRLRERD